MKTLSSSVAFVLLFSLTSLPSAESAPKKTKYSLELVSPAPSEVISGSVDIAVRIPSGPAPRSVYASLGGSPPVKLSRSGDANQWAASLDTTMVPNGEQQLKVITDDKRSVLVTKLTLKNPLKVFFADLHSHTSFSDGTLLPEAAHDYARKVAKLDVFCLTDHLERVDDAEWSRTREVAWKANEDGAFVVLPGLEWTKGWGHINIYDPGTRHWPNEPQEFYEAIAKEGVIAKFNHPGDGSKSHGGLEYSSVGDKAIQLMEVRHEKEEQAYIRALKAGWHIAPDGSDDTHGPNWGSSRAWSGILAPGLSRECIWDALQKRHIYSTLDRNCRLSFEVCGAVMGDIIGNPVEEAEISVAVEDPDTADTVAKIELFEDGEVVDVHEADAASTTWSVKRKPEPGAHFYFVKVTQADGDCLWSAPVWLAAVISWK